MNQEQYARRLRQKIMATAVKKNGWDKDHVHDFMKEWGFGSSLRELEVPRLLEVYRLIAGKKETNIPDEIRLDPQGNYMYYLMKLAGWDMNRVRRLMVSKFEKTDWSILTKKEKRMVVQILKNYADSYEPRKTRKAQYGKSVEERKSKNVKGEK